jgi:hypothetical protein
VIGVLCCVFAALEEVVDSIANRRQPLFVARRIVKRFYFVRTELKTPVIPAGALAKRL